MMLPLWNVDDGGSRKSNSSCLTEEDEQQRAKEGKIGWSYKGKFGQTNGCSSSAFVGCYTAVHLLLRYERRARVMSVGNGIASLCK